MQKPIFSILRLPRIPGFMVPGVMYDHRTLTEGVPFAVTGEHPDKHIPKGIHRCVSTMYHRGGYPTFEILVDDRIRILYHKLNDPFKESEGCIGIAEYFGEVLGRLVIGDSKGGFNEFMQRAKGYNEFLLEIKEGIFA